MGQGEAGRPGSRRSIRTRRCRAAGTTGEPGPGDQHDVDRADHARSNHGADRRTIRGAEVGDTDRGEQARENAHRGTSAIDSTRTLTPARWTLRHRRGRDALVVGDLRELLAVEHAEGDASLPPVEVADERRLGTAGRRSRRPPCQTPRARSACADQESGAPSPWRHRSPPSGPPCLTVLSQTVRGAADDLHLPHADAEAAVHVLGQRQPDEHGRVERAVQVAVRRPGARRRSSARASGQRRDPRVDLLEGGKEMLLRLGPRRLLPRTDQIADHGDSPQLSSDVWLHFSTQ